MKTFYPACTGPFACSVIRSLEALPKNFLFNEGRFFPSFPVSHIPLNASDIASPVASFLMHYWVFPL